jgi:RNA polymerase sigma-70 factor (ECF subfamily)
VVKSRGKAEFEQIMLPHLAASYNLARWLTHRAPDAEDLVQDAYLKAYKSFGGFAGGNSAAWILAIVRNTCLTWLKRTPAGRNVISLADATARADVARVLTMNATDEPPDEAVIKKMERDRLHVAIATLPVAFREVIVLREFAELSYAEIAEITNVPVGTVMSRLARARNRLRDLLSETQGQGHEHGL